MKTMIHIAKKEFAAFFASPAAFIFLGAFLTANMFIFFWIESFFARNIADIQPLFQWMPVLLIFLCSAITMRIWSEERRLGTQELLLTAPLSYPMMIGGKFLACLGLVSLGFFMTTPLTITVSFLGPLDWGPVYGGYLASLFLAAAYIAIGIFISSRSDNPLVALITSVVGCGLLYFIGSPTITRLLASSGGEFLKLLGSGSRFESITRGVIDLRDLTYYLTITGIFLTLTALSLEGQRWAGNATRPRHRSWQLFVLLLTVNLLVLNIWLAPFQKARVDLTENHRYSLSDATRTYLAQLKEPLLIRAYFSEQTHPLLAPLVPRLRDLLKEYEVAGNKKVKVEIITPRKHPDLEQEANEKYGIHPVPFRSASRYQTAVTNSYFDILIAYGNEFETLNFRDLIDVKSQSESDIEVTLKNPEYDISQAIKKVLYSYQSSGNLFENITAPITFTGYVSAAKDLPEELKTMKDTLADILADLDKKSGGSFKHIFIDPNVKGQNFITSLEQKFGFQPMVAGLFSQKTFWFYLVMDDGSQHVQVPLPNDLSADSLKRAMQSALKRFSAGFLKTIGLVTPPVTPPMPQYSMPGRGLQFRKLRQILSQDHNVIDTDLKNGHVPENVDILLVIAPQNLDEKQVFAIDQFFMQGGTVILSTSPYDINLQGSLSARLQTSGLEKWLGHQGINIDKKLVFDPQNSPFPVPVNRNLGGIMVRETKLVNYPLFIDIRPDSMDQSSGLFQGIRQLSFVWGSPVHVNNSENKKRCVIELLHSSPGAWSTQGVNIQPNFNQYGELGFAVGDNTGVIPLAVMVSGSFASWFKDKPSPLLTKTDKETEKNNKKSADQKEKSTKNTVIGRVINHSPDTSRLIVLGSNTFLSDTALSLSSGVAGSQYLTPVQLVANAVDWSLEDRNLLAMRNRTESSRVLLSMDNSKKRFFEYLNYAMAVIGLILIWIIGLFLRRRAGKRYQTMLDLQRRAV